MLTASAPTVQSAASASVGAKIATAVVGSALGSAGGGVGSGVGPGAIAGAQRNFLMSLLGGAPSTCEDPRSKTNGGGWTMGRIGMGQSRNPCLEGDTETYEAERMARRRRRLEEGRRLTAKQDGGSSGTDIGNRNDEEELELVDGESQLVADDDDEDLVQRLLVVAMVDTIMSVLTILSAFTFLHMVALVFWRFVINRRYYAWVSPKHARIIRVDKAEGELLGLSMKSYFIKHVALHSPCAEFFEGGEPILQVGDRIHMVNGCKLRGRACAEAIRSAGTIFFLVSRATSKEAAKATCWSCPSWRVLGPPPAKVMAHAKVTPPDRDHSDKRRVRVRVVKPRKIRDVKMRALYMAMASKLTTIPNFRALPGSLMWPIPEVTLLAAFSSGLLQCSASVVGAYVAGYSTVARNLLLAISTMLMVFLFYGHQAWQLVVFFRHHNEHCWSDAEAPESKADISDPAMAMLTNISCGLIKPRSRVVGEFAAPEEDDEEPGRTERSLARFFCFRRPRFRDMPHGDALAELGVWLGDATGSRRGLWYLFAMIALQHVVALCLGFGQVFPWTVSTDGGRCFLVFVLGTQVLGTVWAACGTANDKIDGFEKLISYGVEGASCGLVLAANVLAQGSGTEGDEAEDLQRLTLSLQFSGLSAQMLLIIVFIPMAITVYNSFICPVITTIWSGDGDWRENLTQMAMTLILLPWSILSAFFGCGGSGLDEALVGEMEGTVVDAAASSRAVVAEGEEGGDSEEEGEEEEEDAANKGKAHAKGDLGGDQGVAKAVGSVDTEAKKGRNFVRMPILFGTFQRQASAVLSLSDTHSRVEVPRVDANEVEEHVSAPSGDSVETNPKHGFNSVGMPTRHRVPMTFGLVMPPTVRMPNPRSLAEISLGEGGCSRQFTPLLGDLLEPEAEQSLNTDKVPTPESMTVMSDEEAIETGFFETPSSSKSIEGSGRVHMRIPPVDSPPASPSRQLAFL